MYYLNYFFIFSIFGHLFETIIFILLNQKGQSGFLYGFWTPVYGIGAILIIIISKKIFEKFNLNKFLEIIIFSVVIMIVLTFIEFIGGNLLNFIFHKDFWNYSGLKYNFGRYISLEVSVIWLIMSLIFLYLIKPWMDKIVNKIPKVITYILIFLLIIDLIFTIVFKNKLIQ